jgi:hypothetical protein
MVELSRKRWQVPAGSGGTGGSVTPLDKLVDALEATMSVGTRELCCRLNAGARSFDKAAENLKRAAQVSLSGETLRKVVENEGKQVAAATESGELTPAWKATECRAKTPSGQEVTQVYLGADAFTVPLVTDAEKQGRRKKVKEKRQKRGRRARPLPSAKKGSDERWKEAKLVTFYDASMTHRQVSVTRGDCSAAGHLMRRDAERLDFHLAQERIGNIDGGPWIIRQVDKNLAMTATGLDFYHLGDNVQKSRRLVFGEESSEGKEFVGRMLHTAKHAGYEALSEGLTQWRKKLRGGKRKEADRLLNYIADRREMIRYPEFIARGWQIGSGPTESQCRQLPERIKGSGMRWDFDNCEAVMALEAMDQSNQWDRYWRKELNRRN